MSAYDNDPRPHRRPDGTWTAPTDEGRTVVVAPMHTNGQVTVDRFGVFDTDGMFLGNAGRLDEVLHSLIGDPK